MDEQKPADDQATNIVNNEPVQTGGQDSPSGGQVMDVSAPAKQIDVTEATTQPETEQAPEAPMDSTPETPTENSEAVAEAPQVSETPEPEAPPTPEPETSEPPTVSSEAEATVSSSMEAPSETTDEAPAAESTTTEATPTENALGTSPAHSQPHKKSPMLAIILAVVVALAIAGAVVYMYLKNKNGEIKRTDNTTATVVEKPQASASDVDTANQVIDTNLQKADDSKDFPTTGLSDTTLGL